jgi:hypothetical protein
LDVDMENLGGRRFLPDEDPVAAGVADFLGVGLADDVALAFAFFVGTNPTGGGLLG